MPQRPQQKQQRQKRRRLGAYLVKLAIAPAVLYCAPAYLLFRRSILDEESLRGRAGGGGVGGDDKAAAAAFAVSPLVTSGRRFPSYGTELFRQTCGWTLGFGGPRQGRAPERGVVSKTEKEKPANCTIFYRPKPQWSEGVAAWSGGIVMAHLRARQVGCRLKFDYGSGVDVTTVLMPHESDLGTHMDWRAPPDFRCDEADGCFLTYDVHAQLLNALAAAAGWPEEPGGGDRQTRPRSADLPNYRKSNFGQVAEADFPGLAAEIGPGFNFTIGMACSLGRLLRLAPSAAEAVPNMETELLPALRDPEALVIALYLRTGQTDGLVTIETKGPNATKLKGQRELRPMQMKQINCAKQIERERLAEAKDRGAPYRRSVWMLVTDSPWVRKEVIRLHSGAFVRNLRSPHSTREVHATTTRGIHTRKKRDPSDLDFAEAVVDWYLMGETDVVVGGGKYSFDKTAALRTHRTYYEGFRGCQPRVLVW